MKKFKHWIQYFQHLHPRLQKALRKFYLVSSIIILVFCREVSQWTSSGNINLWFYHFTIVERVSMLFLLLSAFKQIKEVSWIAGELIFLFLVSDIIDRSIYNQKEINTNDIVTIGILTIISIIKYINFKKQIK